MLTKRLFLLSLSLSLSLSFFAQGKVGINTTTPAAMLHVKDSSVVFTALVNSYNGTLHPPVSGPGIRMMWYPQKAAFRAGYVDGQQWDRDSVGLFSFASGGRSPKARGIYSVAMGDYTTASGDFSVSLGGSNNASGSQSVAIGSLLVASGFSSTAFGNSCIASGTVATTFGHTTKASGFSSTSAGVFSVASGSTAFAMGNRVNARSFSSFVVGSFNDTTNVGGFGGWVTTDPLFVVGNGQSELTRQNALTLLKNGNMGLGTISPKSLLHISKGASGAEPHPTALAAFEDDGDISINLLTPSTEHSSIYFGNLSNVDHGSILYDAPTNKFILNTKSESRLVINDVGHVGIGTVFPDKLLHVHAGSSSATPESNAIAVFEDNTNASINILTPNANESALYFGNPANAVHGGIVYNSTVLNGLAFRTNGNSTKMVINDVGDVGIGDNSPNARLHISEGNGGGLYNANAEVIIEDDDQAYIQFSVPTSEESGILSGNSAASMRSGVLFRADSSLQLRSGGNTTRLVATKAGDIGINTLSPGAKLDVNGTTILGTNGTTLNEIIKATVLKNVTSVAANTSLIVDYSVTNAATTSAVYVSPEVDLTDGLIIAYARVNTAGVVRVKFTNTTGSAIDPPSMNYYITVIR